MKTDEEIQAEIDDPHTKALIIMPTAKNAYLLDKVTLEFPTEISSVVNEETLELKGSFDITKRKALVGMMIFTANPEKQGEEKAKERSEQIDKMVSMIQEAEGDKLDFLAPERVQKQFGVGQHG